MFSDCFPQYQQRLFSTEQQWNILYMVKQIFLKVKGRFFPWTLNLFLVSKNYFIYYSVFAKKFKETLKGSASFGQIPYISLDLCKVFMDDIFRVSRWDCHAVFIIINLWEHGPVITRRTRWDLKQFRSHSIVVKDSVWNIRACQS